MRAQPHTVPEGHIAAWGSITMKAAQLYEYDQEMNVELVVETVPEPTLNSPDEVSPLLLG